MFFQEVDNRSREQLAALCQIGRDVNSSLELGEVLERILAMTLDLFQAEAGSIMLLREGKLRIAAARGLPREVVDTTEVPLGEGIAGWVASTGEMLLLNGKVDDPRFHGLVDRRDEISSSLCTPLQSRSGVIGVVMVRRGGPTTFSRNLLDFFASVADQAAVAIENARLYASEKARARVRDQGIGIPEDKIPFIFEKFHRVDNSLTRRTGGTGLGLANARCIVEGHGGTIWAESEPGRGSTFTFLLPLRVPRAECGSDTVWNP